MRLSLYADPAWRVDRYNGRSREASARGIADRLGTVLGTVGRQQLSNWSDKLKFLSNFYAVRWPRG